MKHLQFKAPHGTMFHHKYGELNNANITEEIKAELVKENEAYENFFEMVEKPEPKPAKKTEEKNKPSKSQSNGSNI